MTDKIRNQTVLITGASSGIGYVTALELARRGARLGLAARREDRLESLARSVAECGAQAFACRTDVRERSQVERFVQMALERFQTVDVLINNAGYGIRARIEDTTPEEYLDLLQVNLLGTVYGIHAVLPAMKRQKRGHIINVSSVAGKRAMPQSGAYSSTKFAVNGMSEALRVELKPYGVRVSTVLPVSTATEFFDVAGRKSGKPAKPVGPIQSSEKVARAIVRCIERPRPEVFCFPPSRALAVLNNLAPGLVDRIAARFMTMH